MTNRTTFATAALIVFGRLAFSVSDDACPDADVVGNHVVLLQTELQMQNIETEYLTKDADEPVANRTKSDSASPGAVLGQRDSTTAETNLTRLLADHVSGLINRVPH